MRVPALLAFATVSLAGCGAPAVSLGGGAREYVATDYSNVLERWTRTESLLLFDELTRALTVTATFESWDFRWAYVIRYGQDFRVTIAERQEMLRRQLQKTRETHDVFLALYGSADKQNDLTRPDSAWIVRLIDSTGNETPPMDIEAVRNPGALVARFYPYNNVWRKAFRVRFPTMTSDGHATIAPTAEWFGLRFAGPLGNTDLTWQLVGER